jgi:hypothetical protein
MADKKKAILLRLPQALADALQRWAQDELRSVNAQIEYLLRDAARQRGRIKEDDSSDATSGDEGDTQ